MDIVNVDSPHGRVYLSPIEMEEVNTPTGEKLKDYIAHIEIPKETEKKKEDVRMERAQSMVRRQALQEEAEKFFKEQQELEKKLSNLEEIPQSKPVVPITALDTSSVFEKPPIDVVEPPKPKTPRQVVSPAPVAEQIVPPSPRLDTKTVLNKYLEEMKINLPKKEEKPVTVTEKVKRMGHQRSQSEIEEERFWKEQEENLKKLELESTVAEEQPATLEPMQTTITETTVTRPSPNTMLEKLLLERGIKIPKK
jgi:hypothetical protein